MWRKNIFSFCIVLVLGISVCVQAGLVAHWSLDEGTGTTAFDSAGDYDGTLVGSPTWTTGAIDGALSFNGTTDCVRIDSDPVFSPAGSFSVALWVNIRNWSTQWALCPFGIRGDGTGWSLRRFGNWWSMQYPDTYTMPYEVLSFTTRGIGHADDGVEDSPSWTVPPQNEWLHIACIYDQENNVKQIYFNGVLDAEWPTASGATMTPATQSLYIGAMSNAGDTGPENFFNGLIDDVRFYDNALSAEELQSVMTGIPLGCASKPNPSNNAVDVVRNPVLSWKTGKFADTHNLFFGTDFNDVNDATAANPLNANLVEALDVNNFNPDRLEFGTTYYWRVDEVNSPSSPGTYKGTVWGFTVEPVAIKVPASDITATASTSYGSDPNDTINESGLNPDNMDMHSNIQADMWLSAAVAPNSVWIHYDFEKAYKLHQMLVWNYNYPGVLLTAGFKDVIVEYSLDGESWTEVPDVPQFAQGTGTNTYKYNTVVDLGDVIATSVRLRQQTNWGMPVSGLSEVRFTYIPVWAREPKPENESVDVPIGSELTWRAGRDAGEHIVYISTDEQAVTDSNAPLFTVAESKYSPDLQMGLTYYWRVDEVNSTETPSVWEGELWSFTASQYITVEDFEDYNDTQPYTVWDTWVDGLTDSTYGGSRMGNEYEPFCEEEIVHGGNQSAPFYYDNTSAAKSEFVANPSSLPIGSNWLAGGADTLVIWFQGTETNAATDQMYVKLNTTKVIYDGDVSDIARTAWTRWEIPLTGINLNNVSSITIGVERIGAAGGSGLIYLDDIGLIIGVEALDPGTSNLVAEYLMENNVQDGSGNGHNGTIVGTPTYVQGKGSHGMALQFNGTTDCVDLGNDAVFNPEGSFSISLWANITDWTTGWGSVMISNRGESPGGGWQIRRYSSTNLCFTTRGISNDDMNSNAVPPLNEWINITCVYDSEAHTKSIYIDGVLDRSINLTGTVTKITATTTNTYIGARANSANTGQEGFFTGMLDDIRIYDKALSAAEVKYLYKN